nr:hypothetical protein [Tanacetum cinerariifolium]
MHNNIMATGLRDHPPMLATGRYPQWRSRFLRYIDTRPNGDALRKCILNGPYIPTTVVVQAIAKTNDSLAVHEHTTLRKCGKLSKGYNKVNPLTFKMSRLTYFRNSPEWSRFMMIVKQQYKLDEVSYHKLFDILKQYQKEVNELHAKRLARNANPLALVATTQVNQEPYYQTSKSHKSYAPSLKPSIPTRSHTTTRSKGKEIAKPITPLSESASKKDRDPKQAPGIRIYRRIWLSFQNTDKEIDEQELKAHYSYMAKIQEVPTADSCTDSEPLEQVQNDTGYNVFANELQHFEQSKFIINTCLVDMDDSNVILDSPDMCDDDIQNDQNDQHLSLAVLT